MNKGGRVWALFGDTAQPAVIADEPSMDQVEVRFAIADPELRILRITVRRRDICLRSDPAPIDNLYPPYTPIWQRFPTPPLP